MFYRILFTVLLGGLLNLQSFTQTAESVALQEVITSYEAYKRPEAPGKWPNFSETVLTAEKATFINLLATLKAIPSESLTLTENINKDFLELVISNQLFDLDFQGHLIPLNAEGGFVSDILYKVQERPIRSNKDYDQYLAQLKALPDYIDLRIKHMEKGQKQGKSSPKLITQDCINFIQNILDIPVEESALMQSLKGYSGNTDQIEKVINKNIIPAYKRLKSYLQEEYLDNAPDAIGISEVSGGKAFYQQRTEYFATYDIAPKQVFDLGLKEVKRIRAEMDAILEKLEFEGSYADFLNFLRTDPQFYAKTDREILDYGSNITNRMQGKMLAYFTRLPEIPLTVTPVPAELAPNYTAGRSSPGSLTNQKPGEFWINTFDLPSRPLYALPALALHEGIPGHHLQIMLALEMKNVPAYRQKTYISAFGEGWALYAEHLGQEAGIYQTPYEDFGRLTYEMWRACRLVVDPGMHYFGWSREKAATYLAENTALSFREVNSEINRYIGWPGQAISYKLGELKIKELRAKAERELGDSFNITEFHDTVLENGSIPLNTLSNIVDNYIQTKKNQE